MTVKIEGLDAIMKKLDGLGKPGVFKPPMQQSVNHIKRVMKKYPPKPPQSTYRRTRQLGNKWTTKVTNRGRTGEIGNDVKYGRWVQDATRQVKVHKATGWPTIQDVVKSNAKAVRGFFKTAYDKELAK